MDACNRRSDPARRGSRGVWLACTTLAVGVALCGPARVARGCDADGAGAAFQVNAATGGTESGGPAMRAHVDPATGKLVAPAAGEVAPAELVGGTPAQPVRQEPVPGGGFKVDMPRRVLQSEGSK